MHAAQSSVQIPAVRRLAVRMQRQNAMSRNALPAPIKQSVRRNLIAARMLNVARKRTALLRNARHVTRSAVLRNAQHVKRRLNAQRKLTAKQKNVHHATRKPNVSGRLNV